jgi:hypothetical protein
VWLYNLSTIYISMRWGWNKVVLYVDHYLEWKATTGLCRFHWARSFYPPIANHTFTFSTHPPLLPITHPWLFRQSSHHTSLIVPAVFPSHILDCYGSLPITHPWLLRQSSHYTSLIVTAVFLSDSLNTYPFSDHSAITMHLNLLHLHHLCHEPQLGRSHNGRQFCR